MRLCKLDTWVTYKMLALTSPGKCAGGYVAHDFIFLLIIEGSLEVKLPTIWTDEKQSWAEAERRGQ
jgi:hypothetical protein